VLDRRFVAGERERVRPRVLLLDIDGVLYVEDEPVLGAVAAVRRLRAAGGTLRFVTNTTSRSRAATLAKLARLGFTVVEDELVTPAALAVRVCRERGLRRVALFVQDEVEVDFAGLDKVSGASRADAVIVGDLGEAWDYAALNAAFRLVMDGADLIALQKNRFWLRADGLSLDGPKAEAPRGRSSCSLVPSPSLLPPRSMVGIHWNATASRQLADVGA
jgi:phospholysine phosphohistidine inorganic pyrophosphate phosphatase